MIHKTTVIIIMASALMTSCKTQSAEAAVSDARDMRRQSQPVWIPATNGENDKKVAVFDPAGNVESSLKEIVREEISSAIVNTGGYAVLERALINKVIEENKFQSGGLVDDEQISEIGKRLGADYVFVTSVSPLGKNYYISCKMIEVMTARIEKQKTGKTNRSVDDVIPVVQNLMKSMFVREMPPPEPKEAEETKKTKKAKKEKKQAVNIPAAVDPTGRYKLLAKGAAVYDNSEKLKKAQARSLMANAPEAFKLYNTGQSRRTAGAWLMVSGGGVIAGSLVLWLATDVFTYYEYARYGLAIFEEKYNRGNTFAAICIPVGAALAVAGVGLRISGKKAIRQAVDTYNQPISPAPPVSLQLGFTGNGVGLTYSF